LMNLCVNARDAMPAGGTLTLEVDNYLVDEIYAKTRPDAKSGPYVAIGVSDTGSGIPPAILEKIFDPFFTTKEIGKGTGLGLSTVLAIVKNHGGFINVYSEVGNGTRITAYFPAVKSSTEGEIVGQQISLLLGKGQHILVIDDETSVLEITRQTLELHGYNVLTSSDGMEAVTLFADKKDEVDLVLTDVMMPYLEGTALIQVIHKMNPTVKIIASSGFKGNDPTSKLPQGYVFAFLLKPYTAGSLLQTLQKAFSQPG
ncbi:MAG TPA: ATP-binding protein, partial [Bacteroidota bacterium]|nr:ATP-binding protein [Bacteroidota bacterium]